MKREFLTPVGRMVQGDPLTPQTTNMAGQPLVTKSGQPTQRFFIAVAFPKSDTGFAALYQSMAEVARASFPQLFNAQGQCTHPRFSWKLMDGDGVDDNGKPNANKPGFAGCWVLKFSSSFAPRCFYAGRYQPHEAIQDPKALPRGYYVRVSGSREGNDDPNKPGLYMNLSLIELVGGQPSDIIQSGPDASQVFGGAAAALPPGVAPVVPGGPMAAPAAALPSAVPGLPVGSAPGLPGAAMPGAAAAVPNFAALPNSMPGAAAPAMMSPTSPLAVPPNPAFLAGPGAAPGVAAPVPGMPAVAAAPAVGVPTAPVFSGPVMTAKAGGATYEQFRAQGWDDARMRAEGYML